MSRESSGRKLFGAFALSIVIHALLVVLVLIPFRERLHLRPALEANRSAFSATIHFLSEVVPPDAAHTTSIASTKVNESVTFSRGQDEKPSPSKDAFNRSQLTQLPTADSVPPVRDSSVGGPTEPVVKPERQPLPPAPNYLDSTELDSPPFPLQDIEPEYPETVGMQEGSVVLRILINELGGVDNVAVVRSFPPIVFDDAAMSAFRNAIFSPGKVLGLAVKSQVTVEVQFTPLNRGGNVTGRGY